jgi:hypothetical protein
MKIWTMRDAAASLAQCGQVVRVAFRNPDLNLEAFDLPILMDDREAAA